MSTTGKLSKFEPFNFFTYDFDWVKSIF